MNTLLHICCAPCANQCIRVLREEGREVTGFWYNPNIHPFTEYRSRRNCLREYAAAIALPLIEKKRLRSAAFCPGGGRGYFKPVHQVLRNAPDGNRKAGKRGGL